MATDDSHDRYYTNPGDIYSVFRALQTDRSTINVQFDKQGALFNSLILDASLKKRIVLLDEITPQAGHRKAVAGEPFSLRASVHGIRVYAPELAVLQAARNDSGYFYSVAFPERLLYLQRRDAFRVPVPARLKVEATCRFEDQRTLGASVDNLSATGVRLLLPGEQTPALTTLPPFELDLTIPSLPRPLRLKTRVVHQHMDRQRNATVCGCRFEAMPRPDQITLNQLVTQLQREALT